MNFDGIVLRKHALARAYKLLCGLCFAHLIWHWTLERRFAKISGNFGSTLPRIVNIDMPILSNYDIKLADNLLGTQVGLSERAANQGHACKTKHGQNATHTRVRRHAVSASASTRASTHAHTAENRDKLKHRFA